MKTQLNVVKRKGSDVYYFRARIPADLQQHYGKSEAWVSLHTKDIRQANNNATIERLKLDQQLADIRALATGNTYLRATQTELERIVLLWFLGLEDTDNLPTDTHLLVDTELAKHGINLNRDSKEFKTVYNLFSKALERINVQLKAMPSSTSQDSPKASCNVSQPILDGNLQHLLSYWKTQSKPSPRSIEAATFAINQLERLTNNKPVSKLTKADLVNYKDKRLEKVSPATVEKDLSLLNAIFNTAVNNAKLTANPAEGVKAPMVKAARKPRVSFNIEDLKRIFSSPIYTKEFRPLGGAGEASYWLPLMALFTGARLSELSQLLIEDIKEEQGIKYILISTDSESTRTDKRLKTASSHRRVPIHPELIRCGLLEYVSSMKLMGHNRLFPAIQSESKQASAPYSKWFNGTWLRRTLGITDTRKVFHSFRHTFKDGCRVAELLSEHHDRLTGHSRGSIGDSYGAEFYPLKPLANAIHSLSFEGLDLSNLYINQPTERK